MLTTKENARRQPSVQTTADEFLRDLHSRRTPRRQRLCQHIHAAGPRPLMEALIAIAGGDDLDAVLEDFGRIPVATYHAMGASEMPGVFLDAVKGGRE